MSKEPLGDRVMALTFFLFCSPSIFNVVTEDIIRNCVVFFFFQTYIVYALCKKGWGYQMRVGSLRNKVPGSGFLRR